MNEQWQELKETIAEIRDNNKFEHEDVTILCRFLIRYMDILEKEVTSQPCEDCINRQDALNAITMAEVRWQAIEHIKALSPVIPQPCNDAINRDKAIIQLSHNKIGDDDCNTIIQKDIETIKALLSLSL